MSYHTINPELEARLIKQRREATIASLIIGILLLSLLALIFWAITITVFTKKTDPMVAYSSQEPIENTIEKVKISPTVTKTPTPASSSAAVKVITATAATSSFSVPSPDVAVENMSLDFGESEGFGSGWGSSASFGNGGSAGGAFTLFGKQGGGGLVGNFYDLKNDKKKKVTTLGKFYIASSSIGQRLPEYAKFIKSKAKAGFKQSDFSKYYMSETQLSFTNLVMPSNTSADEAPTAFQAKGVDPSGWVVVYEGKIGKPSSGSSKVRFVGMFDDFLFVYINGKLALNGACISANSFGLPMDEPKEGAQMRGSMPLRVGDWVNIKNGTDIKIVVGESPGGHMGGGLFIEQEGVDYKPDGEGGKILPPFTTEPLGVEEIERLEKIVGGGKPFPIELENVPHFPATR